MILYLQAKTLAEASTIIVMATVTNISIAPNNQYKRTHGLIIFYR